MEYLLWLDDSNKPLAEKVQAVAARWREKFGSAPNVCYVNPAMVHGPNIRACSEGECLRAACPHAGDEWRECWPVVDGRLTLDGLGVAARSTVLLHHFMVGREKRDD